MRWLPFALLLASGPALAGGIKPTRLTGKLDGTTARISARYALAVDAGTWAAPQVTLDLPRDGLITSARASLDGVTHELGLLAVDAAEAKFQALAADEVKPGAKTAAVLIASRYGSDATISVASPRKGTLVVDLEIAVPTCYLREVRYVAVPVQWSALPGTTRTRASNDDVEAACGKATEDRVWTGFASRDLANLPSGARIAASGDRADLGSETIVRVELGLASALADIPRDLATVIVVDNSRSIEPNELEAQRQIVQGYLKAAPASRVQLVAFARFAHPILAGWMNASSSAPSITKALARFVPQNGSNVDAGLAEAATWLRKIQGTRRVVLITDERMAKRLQTMTADALKQRLPPGTLLHVVVPSSHTGTFHRDDDGALAPLAAATEGMRMQIGPAEPDQPRTMVELVRPTSLDRLKLTAPGWEPLSASDREPPCEDEQQLDEGAGCTWWGKSKPTNTQPITIEGKLWGKTFKRVVTPTLARAQDLVRQLSMHPVTPSELREIADEQARAVNGKWSLYAAWGGTGTYEVHGGAGSSSGICGCDAPGRIGHGIGVGNVRLGTSQQTDLRAQLADQLATCNLGTERVQVDVELTLTEIVDVHARAQRPEHARCVEEVVWASAPTIANPRPFQVMSFVAGG